MSSNAAFTAADADHSGFLEGQEVVDALMDAGVEVDDAAEAKELLFGADLDTDGKLTSREFARAVKKASSTSGRVHRILGPFAGPFVLAFFIAVIFCSITQAMHVVHTVENPVADLHSHLGNLKALLRPLAVAAVGWKKARREPSPQEVLDLIKANIPMSMKWFHRGEISLMLSFCQTLIDGFRAGGVNPMMESFGEEMMMQMMARGDVQNLQKKFFDQVMGSDTFLFLHGPVARVGILTGLLGTVILIFSALAGRDSARILDLLTPQQWIIATLLAAMLAGTSLVYQKGVASNKIKELMFDSHARDKYLQRIIPSLKKMERDFEIAVEEVEKEFPELD